jgi:hypothetical protein
MAATITPPAKTSPICSMTRAHLPMVERVFHVALRVIM